MYFFLPKCCYNMPAPLQSSQKSHSWETCQWKRKEIYTIKKEITLKAEQQYRGKFSSSLIPLSINTNISVLLRKIVHFHSGNAHHCLLASAIVCFQWSRQFSSLTLYFDLGHRVLEAEDPSLLARISCVVRKEKSSSWHIAPGTKTSITSVCWYMLQQKIQRISAPPRG